MSDTPIWPMRLFVLIFALVGILELARNGLSLPAGFYLFGTVGLLLAGAVEGTISESRPRRYVGLALVGIGSVLMLIHLVA